MKKLLHTALLLIGLSTFVSAQINYQILPNPVTGKGSPQDSDREVSAEIYNLTAQTLQLHWVRNVISLTPGCETAVCDAVVCYAKTVSSHNFYLLPDTIRPFLVHFYSHGAPCAGIVHVKVTNQNDPEDSVNVVFLYNQNTGFKDLPSASVKLYPNPATDYFALEQAENVATIRVFTLDGREIARFEASANNVYPFQNQAAGTYVLALEDKNGNAFQALELRKQ